MKVKYCRSKRSFKISVYSHVLSIELASSEHLQSFCLFLSKMTHNLILDQNLEKLQFFSHSRLF